MSWKRLRVIKEQVEAARQPRRMIVAMLMKAGAPICLTQGGEQIASCTLWTADLPDGAVEFYAPVVIRESEKFVDYHWATRPQA